MPIARRQFELSIDADIEKWMRRIYAFLEDHGEEAYSVKELGEIFDVPEHLADIKRYYEWDDNRRSFLRSLQRLAELQAVSEREVGDVKYYARGLYALPEILAESSSMLGLSIDELAVEKLRSDVLDAIQFVNLEVQTTSGTGRAITLADVLSKCQNDEERSILARLILGRAIGLTDEEIIRAFARERDMAVEEASQSVKHVRNYLAA